MAGTELVKDIYTANAGSGPIELTPFNGKLYFMAEQPGVAESGLELFSTDGTEAGTNLVLDLNPGSAGTNSVRLRVFGDYLYFTGDNGVTGKELWRTDGTAAGTVLVADINPGSAASDPFDLIVSGNYLYFGATTAANGQELWRTDGTPGRTIRLSDVNPGAGNSSIRVWGESNGTVYFTANNSAGFAGLWRSSGTVATTAQHSTAFNFISSALNVNGTLYVAGPTSTTGNELFKIVGTGAPVLVKDIYPGSSDSAPQQLTKVGNTLFFSAHTSGADRELWKSDGTAAGTVMVKDINPAAFTGSQPQFLVEANGVLYFRADNGVVGAELWRSDGTAAGTYLVKDIWPGVGSSIARRFFAAGGFVYMAAEDGVNGLELWQTDGTPGGTGMVADLYPENSAASFFFLPGFFAAMGGEVFLRLTDDTHGDELWKAQPDFATLDAAAGILSVSATANNDTIDISATASGVTVTLNGMTKSFAPGGAVASVQLLSKGGNDTVNINSGSLILSADLGDEFASKVTLNVADGASVVFDATQHLAALNLLGSANATLAAGGNRMLITNTIALAPQSKLDLADNDLAIAYNGASPLGSWNGSAYTGLVGLIQSGRTENGTWDGAGIVTSMSAAAAGLTTLASGEASEILSLTGNETAIWNGETVDATTVIIKYTYAGDANLDGVIDGGDYGVIDNFVQVPNAFGYFNGDFNYDGVIDGGDYGIIDNNIQAQGAAL